MAKRKAADLDSEEVRVLLRRSGRRKTSDEEEPPGKTPTMLPSTNGRTERRVPPSAEKPPSGTEHAPEQPSNAGDVPSTQQFWLMKAEPESRIENGLDVKFSIDDLAAKSEPEPWDGIRAYAARNNLRAMKKGDLAFFYHSNCKVPGIVGIMEIVKEHTPDWSAQDHRTAYYDPKDTDSSNPRWSVVHVRFLRKFKQLIARKELLEFAASGELSKMQTLKQSRLSVSKVGKSEWDFLLGVADEKEKSGD